MEESNVNPEEEPLENEPPAAEEEPKIFKLELKSKMEKLLQSVKTCAQLLELTKNEDERSKEETAK